MPTTPTTCPDCGSDTGKLMTYDFGFGERSMVFACDPCVEAKQLERKQKEAESLRKEREKNWNAICPPLYLDTLPELLPGPARQVLPQLMAWTYNPKGLLLAGPTRTGKSRLMYLFLKNQFMRGYSVKVMSGPAFASQIHEASLTGKMERVLQEYVRVGLLAINDLGKSRFTPTAEESLFRVLDERAEHKRPVIITTNDTAVTMAERMSDNTAVPMQERLKEFATPIVLNWPSHGSLKL